MRALLILLLLLSGVLSVAGQALITGKVKDKNGGAIAGASIFIKDSYDGTTSSDSGAFRLQTTMEGKQMLTVQCMGYKAVDTALDLSKGNADVTFVLHETQAELAPIVITAGSFDASDERKAVALKPMDIVTTASAGGDIYGALSTLPGTQTVGETGKLFVRGGDEYEAKTFIDGLQVESPYLNRLDGIPARGRFSPMLFSGTMFSTGGYSSEYGQALSAVALLKTDGMPAASKTNVNLYSLGFGVSQTKKFDSSAYIAALDYSNLGPYFNVVKQSTDWVKAPQTISATLDVINKPRWGGLSKTLVSYNDDRSSLNYPYYGYSSPNVLLTLLNHNLFVKNSYMGYLAGRTSIQTGLGFSLDRNDLNLDSMKIKDKLVSGQIKLTFVTDFAGKVKLSYGGDLFFKSFMERITLPKQDSSLPYRDVQHAVFVEMEYKVSSRLALRAGAREEYSAGIGQLRVMPRISAAFRLSDNSQVSAAFGSFYQNPVYAYLKITDKLRPEEAVHFILNYQYKIKDRLFRIEGFYKSYRDLVTYKIINDPNPADYDNNGHGYARGIDVFYRDSRSIKNGDFWLSYSLLDTKKLYQDYLKEATPKFFSTHNFHLVYKQWFASIKSFLGLTFSYASGRPFYDPNKPAYQFLSDRTKPYVDLSMNYSYDLSKFTKIPVTFYTSVSNILGHENIYGYNNAYNTTSHTYDLIPIMPQSKRFYLAAIFISL
ncbi:MAG: TonB-dependent receptor [Chitinophagaceae bacterium]|nr:TonB-dependent receptor [Chitinophagaceae bacterium]